jgi:preprotein translocase subunit SecE
MADKVQQKGFLGFVKRAGLKVWKTLLDIRSELKKVIWPDRRKLMQSTATVIAIVIVFGAVIWIVDLALGSFLEVVGFFKSSGTTYATPTPVPSVTSTVTPTASASPAATATPAA